MATKSVTKAVAFDESPAYPDGMFQVNANVPTMFALSQAKTLSDFVRLRLQDAVGSEAVGGDEAFVYTLIMGMSQALYAAAGVES